MQLSLITEVRLKTLVRTNESRTNTRGKKQNLKVKLNAYNKKARKARFSVEGLTDKYDVFVDFIDKLKVDKKLISHDIKVSCSCPDFKYRCSYALDERYDAAERRYDNGKPPDITNPGRTKHICKHIVRLQVEMNELIFTKNLNLKRLK